MPSSPTTTAAWPLPRARTAGSQPSGATTTGTGTWPHSPRAIPPRTRSVTGPSPSLPSTSSSAVRARARRTPMVGPRTTTDPATRPGATSRAARAISASSRSARARRPRAAVTPAKTAPGIAPAGTTRALTSCSGSPRSAASAAAHRTAAVLRPSGATPTTTAPVTTPAPPWRPGEGTLAAVDGLVPRLGPAQSERVGGSPDDEQGDVVVRPCRRRAHLDDLDGEVLAQPVGDGPRDRLRVAEHRLEHHERPGHRPHLLGGLRGSAVASRVGRAVRPAVAARTVEGDERGDEDEEHREGPPPQPQNQQGHVERHDPGQADQARARAATGPARRRAPASGGT